jgi:alanine or glycine:cation symporter, AGCS family
MIGDIESALERFAAVAWGTPLLVLLLGGGAYFAIRSRGLPYLHFGEALALLRRRPGAGEPGDLSHFQSLSTALAGTIGLGNLAGVAVAIQTGGPGAVFWMWISALVGIATKFFTCTLAVLYRGRDDRGRIQGGPMYVVALGLGPRWRPLATLFCVAGLIGTLPLFQANQVTQILRDVVAVPAGITSPDDHLVFDLAVGASLAVIVGLVVLGGVSRIGAFAARMVPSMIALHAVVVAALLFIHLDAVPAALLLIVRDAFTGEAVAGGAVGTVVMTGIRRGAFSNEAGIGTEAMAHAAARTDEPVREGLVAMLGPAIDTLVVCTATALAILVTGVWQGGESNGVTVTALAFDQVLPGAGPLLLVVIVLAFGLSTMTTYGYYGAKCIGFLAGTRHEPAFRVAYVAMVAGGAVATLDAVIALIDGMYALMAIPTMTSAILLAPRVMEEADRYFRAREA